MPPPLQTPLSAEAVEEAFYDAMRRGDLAAMMALWADEDEVICAHPNGPRHVGLEAVRASHPRLDLAGNSYRGISMNLCCRDALATAAAVGA